MQAKATDKGKKRVVKEEEKKEQAEETNKKGRGCIDVMLA
jgi:hypothetical protein